MAGAAITLAVAGGFLGRRADDAYEEYRTTESAGRYDLLRDRVKRDALGANLLFGGAAAAALGASVSFVLDF
jgi:hypothetical protein